MRTEDEQALAVSVVIPTHSRPDMLSAAIEAVAAQTLLPAELVVVSDVDDPATAEVVAAAAEHAPFPIRLVANQAEPGASGSRNAGARAASSEWLAFLDDDDLWKPEHLAESAKTLRASGAPLAISGIEIFNSTSSAPGLQLGEGVTAAEAAARAHGVTGSNIVIRDSAFWSIEGFDPRLRHLNDRDFFYRCMLAGIPYAFSPALTARYRKHEAGQLSGASEGRARGVQAYLSKHLPTLTRRDRRKLRYQIAVMRYRSTPSVPQKVRWLASAALNASYGHQFDRLRKVASRRKLLSGQAFASDSAQV